MTAAPLSPRELAALDALREAGVSGLLLADLRRALDTPDHRTHVAGFIARARRAGHEVVSTFVGMASNTHVYRYTLDEGPLWAGGAGCTAFGLVPIERKMATGAPVSLARVAFIDGSEVAL